MNIDINKDIVDCAIKCIGMNSVQYNGDNRGLNPEDGFDCSGLINFILKNVKYSGDIPRHAKDLFNIGIRVNNFKPGDLIFFSYKRNGSYGKIPTHVGINISNKEYVSGGKKENGKVCTDYIEDKVAEIPFSKNQVFTKNPIGFVRIINNTF